MGDQFEYEDYGITRQDPDKYLWETKPMGTELLELGKLGCGMSQN